MIRFAPLPLLLAAFPASAEVLTLPAGCTALMSVQHRGCQVSLYWRCEGQDGYVQASTNDAGLDWVTVRDGAGQWLEMRNMQTGLSLLTEMPAPDPSDHGTLIAAGTDSYDYTMVSNPIGMILTYRGTNEVVGPVTVDDEEATEITFDYRVEDLMAGTANDVLGSAYIVGPDQLSITAGWRNKDGSAALDVIPVEILTEGEPGFMDTRPRHDCGDPLS